MKKIIIILIFGFTLLAGSIFYGIYSIKTSLQQTTENIFQPVKEANYTVQTQIADFLHPTPTIIPEPVSIIHEIRSLARLETIEYSVEKVITAEVGGDNFAFLFGDRLLFIAHGKVIAGTDLSKIRPEDIQQDRQIVTIQLPAAEIFVAALENDKSYVYNRETGIFSKGDVNLETQARQAAEEAIKKAALENGILLQAQQNTENYLSRLIRSLGFTEVFFRYIPPGANP